MTPEQYIELWMLKFPCPSEAVRPVYAELIAELYGQQLKIDRLEQTIRGQERLLAMRKL
jgi:hypothetical protein